MEVIIIIIIIVITGVLAMARVWGHNEEDIIKAT